MASSYSCSFASNRICLWIENNSSGKSMVGSMNISWKLPCNWFNTIGYSIKNPEYKSSYYSNHAWIGTSTNTFDYLVKKKNLTLSRIIPKQYHQQRGIVQLQIGLCMLNVNLLKVHHNSYSVLSIGIPSP